MSISPEQLARDEIVKYGGKLSKNGLISGTGGNISVRLNDQVIIITPAGVNKGRMSSDDLVAIDNKGILLGRRGTARPSSELRIHLYVYAMRVDVLAVIHAHPIYTIGLSWAGVRIENVVLPIDKNKADYVVTARYATPSTWDMVESVREYIKEGRDRIILEKHGTLTLGRTLEDAFNGVAAIENLAKMKYKLCRGGG